MASANSTEEDLYNWYFVFDGLEKGVQAQEIGVADPFLPVGIGGGGSTSRDATLHILLRRAEITAEVNCNDGVTSL